MNFNVLPTNIFYYKIVVTIDEEKFFIKKINYEKTHICQGPELKIKKKGEKYYFYIF